MEQYLGPGWWLFRDAKKVMDHSVKITKISVVSFVCKLVGAILRQLFTAREECTSLFFSFPIEMVMDIAASSYEKSGIDICSKRFLFGCLTENLRCFRSLKFQVLLQDWTGPDPGRVLREEDLREMNKLHLSNCLSNVTSRVQKARSVFTISSYLLHWYITLEIRGRIHTATERSVSPCDSKIRCVGDKTCEDRRRLSVDIVVVARFESAKCSNTLVEDLGRYG